MEVVWGDLLGAVVQRGEPVRCFVLWPVTGRRVVALGDRRQGRGGAVGVGGRVARVVVLVGGTRLAGEQDRVVVVRVRVGAPGGSHAEVAWSSDSSRRRLERND